ncbi:MAG: hypothetical protein IIX43_02610, partial [Bacteroidales bacterium]|nr:hypothetical protein [Bacteroidales bacterium]
MKKLSMFLIALAMLCSTSLFAQSYQEDGDYTISSDVNMYINDQTARFGVVEVMDGGTLAIELPYGAQSIYFENLIIRDGGSVTINSNDPIDALIITCGTIEVNGGAFSYEGHQSSEDAVLAGGTFVLNSGTVNLDGVVVNGMNITVNGGSFMLNGEEYNGNTEGGEPGEPDLPIENYNLKA